MSRFKSLASRVAVAVPGIVLFLLVTYLNIDWVTAAFFGLVALLASIEAIRLVDCSAPVSLMAAAGAATGLATAGVSLLDPPLLLPVILAPGALASIWFVLSSGTDDACRRAGGSIGILAVISIGFGLLARLRVDFQSSWILLIPLLICWISDTLAYFAGSAWGKHKMAPRISPNKSWEGFAAGIAGAVLGAVIAGSFGAGLPLPLMMATGAISGLAAVFGDLLESSLKRGAGVKDSGSILPGHGGILDRFDSILAVTPVVWTMLVLHSASGPAG